MRLQKYDLKIIYEKGSQLFIADTLSSGYPTKIETGKENQGFCTQLEEINLVSGIPIAEQQLDACRRATSTDTELQ